MLMFCMYRFQWELSRLFSCLQSLPFPCRRTQDFTMEGVHMDGGRARGLGDEVPQRLNQNVKLAYNF